MEDGDWRLIKPGQEWEDGDVRQRMRMYSDWDERLLSKPPVNGEAEIPLVCALRSPPQWSSS